ncbi:hypothetical protein SAMD00019534_012070, partial [Acytostelium subglobosum LB1]|uniref:hypothetical protein n=1 Tax=Acytostelium subglobosum LB1 TaxID=1410327 RepID=UPI000644BF90
MNNNISSCCLLLVLLIACSTIMVTAELDGSATYYLYTKTKSKCSDDSKTCARYFFRELNSVLDWIPVINIEYEARLNSSLVASAADKTVIALGFFKEMSIGGDPFRSFKMIHAFRLMPQIANSTIPPDTGVFFTMTGGESPGSKCKNCYAGTQLNSKTNTVSYVNVTNPYDKIATLDKTWLEFTLTQGLPMTSVLSIGQDKKTKRNILLGIYINVQDPDQPCQNNDPVYCPDGEMAVFHRDPRRCYVSDKCVKAGKCAKATTAKCPTNYRLTSFPALPDGCLKHFCEPNFLVKTAYKVLNH